LATQLAAKGFRPISMDIRGHGESSTGWEDFSVAGVGSDIVALIRELKSGPAAIVGTSMGAGAAVWAAAEAPGLVSGLALIGPFVRGNGGGPLALLFRMLFARPWGPGMWVRYYSMLYPTRKPADLAQYKNALRDNLKQAGRLEALQKMLQASKRSSEERLARVRKPTLVLMGSKDPDFKKPESEAEWVADQLHGSYEMIRDAGHYPHAEMPEVAGPRLLEFLRQLEPAKVMAYAA
jgi:pimeloyl-ACP methyl ester carboxylesterase